MVGRSPFNPGKIVSTSIPRVTGHEPYWGTVALDEDAIDMINKSPTLQRDLEDYGAAVSSGATQPMRVGPIVEYETGKNGGITLFDPLTAYPTHAIVGNLAHELGHFENREADRAFDRSHSVNDHDPNAFAMAGMRLTHQEGEAIFENWKVNNEIKAAKDAPQTWLAGSMAAVPGSHTPRDTGMQKALDDQHAADVAGHLTDGEDRQLMIAAAMGPVSTLPSMGHQDGTFENYASEAGLKNPETGPLTKFSPQFDKNGEIQSMSETWASGRTVTQAFEHGKLASSSTVDKDGSVVSNTRYQYGENGAYQTDTTDAAGKRIGHGDYAADGSAEVSQTGTDGITTSTNYPPAPSNPDFPVGAPGYVPARDATAVGHGDYAADRSAQVSQTGTDGAARSMNYQPGQTHSDTEAAASPSVPARDTTAVAIESDDAADAGLDQ
ncbi:hypothetical protein [Caballeronia sp. LZ035]|uniref:hypothetical protein n=1 Tax=Caballeronia sp. LZ035 TaxID=3038568 RepID=UPI0028594566|nr:hypothetical protein [Caballeronia sp. LZ035]MDR5761746.1 hypothetical protein [Caballeronia sp. LZ035]